MAEVFREDFDGLADGTPVTAANTAFDTNSGDGIIEADTAFSVTGGVSCAFICAAATENVRLDDAFAATGSRWFRWYFRPPTPLTLANRPRLVALFSVSTHQAGLLLENNGTLTIINGSSAVGTTTTAVTPGEWHRLEWGVVNGGNNELRLFVGANVHGTVPDETVSAAYSEGTFDSFSIGPWVARDAWTHHVDSVVADDAGFPGPEVVTTPVTEVQQASNSEAGGITDVHSATLTSAPTEGNLLVAVVAARGGTDTWTDPPGWSRKFTQGISGGNLACWTRTAGPSESSTFQVTYSSAARAWCVWLVELTGQDEIPLDVAVSANFASATSATVTSSPAEAAVADEYSIAFVAVREGNSTGFAWTDGFAEEALVVAPGIEAIVLDAASKPLTPAGVVSTVASWTNANAGGWGLLTFKPGVNAPPTADAGLDQTVTEGVVVNLDGTGSTDPEDGQAGLSYAWTVSNDGGTGLVNADITGRLTDTASFTAPDVAAQASIVLQLEVTDTGGLTDVDTVTVTVNPVLTFPQSPLDVHVELKLAGVWTDITGFVYVRDTLTIKRGRSDEASRVDPGTLTMTLDNRDGRFSPRNPTGAFYGLIGRNTAVRVYINHGGPRFDRFAGEISSWPQLWNLPETDVYVQVEAAGILRRISQGAGPLQSAMRRHLTSPDIASPPVAYWPLEDGRDAGAFASGLTSGRPMTITGDLDLATDGSFVASSPLPTLDEAIVKGRVQRYDDTGSHQVRFLLSVPDEGATDNTTIMSVYTDGTASRYDLVYDTFGGGGLSTVRFNADDNAEGFSTFLDADLNGNPSMVSLEWTQNGPDVDALVVAWKVGAVDSLSAVDNNVGETFGRVTQVVLNRSQNLDQVAVGHVSVHNRITPITDIESLQGHTGETPLARVTRLCAEEGIGLQTVGAGDAPWLGPQFPATLAELLEEAAEASSGVLYEPRDELAVGFRARGSIYNQVADATLDYAAKQVAPPLEPTDDDQNTRNDVTVSNQAGTSARVVQTDGPLSVNDPPVGVGRYNEDVTVSADHGEFLPHMAGWRIRLGTVDEARYPMVTVDYASPAISSAAALTEALLNLDSGDRLVIDNPPPWLPPEDISLIVQGYEEVLEPFGHRATFNCTPESPWRVAVLDQTGNTASRYGPSNSTLEGGGGTGDFPNVADFSTSGTSSVVSQHSIAVPAHEAGDIIVLYYSSASAPGTPPSDLGGASWTLLESGGFSDANRVWWLRAANSEGSTVTVTPTVSDSFAAVAVRVTGAHPSSAVEAASIGTADPPALDPAGWGIENTLWLAAYCNVSGDVSAIPTGYTLVVDNDPGDVVAVARRDNAAASEDPGPFTTSLGDGLASTVAIRPGIGPVDSTSTSLSVATASGPLWTTDAGEFPLDIMVGGERMTVTDIDFTSSPQTFTVTRSINGVQKAHAAGTQVELFQAAYRAL